MATVQFTDAMLTRARPSGLDVATVLRDFSIITYAVPMERLTRHIPPQFVPEQIETSAGPRGLVSAVPFRDTDFRFSSLPMPGLSFGQTNYRAYVRDRETGARAVWFFGTALDSATVLVPRHIWKLPWHRARIRFDTTLDTARRRYTAYRMHAVGRWGAADLRLDDTGEPVGALEGFPNAETTLVVLTHPLRGVFERRDGAIGTYSVWHDRLSPTIGICRDARFSVFDALGLVPFAEQSTPHSVLIQPETAFTIYLPPRRLAE